MATKGYSAGAIFLQVVPVFANVQRAIEDEAKNIDRALGDQLEKSGEKAGEKAGKAASKALKKELDEGAREASGAFEREFHKNVDGINKALGGIDVKKLGNDLRKELTSVKKEIDSLKDVDLTIDADKRKADHALAELEGRVQALRDGVKIIFRSDIDDALKGFAKVKALKDSVADPIDIEVRVDTTPAERAMGVFEKKFKKVTEKAASHLSGSMNPEIIRLRKQLEGLNGLRIGVDISASAARVQLQAIEVQLEHLSRTHDIDLKVDAGAGWAELKAFDKALDHIDGRTATAKVKVDGDGANSALRKIVAGGDSASNSFRSFNIILLAAAGLGPALIPVLAGIAGGLIALGPASAVAVAGLGAVLVGFSGLGDAVKALGDQSSDGGKAVEAAADRMRTASYAVKDAEDALADARKAAAEGVEDAIDAAADAQKRYRDAVQDVADAEQALRDARAAAANDGVELDLAIRENELAIDQGMLDAFNATVEFNSVMADGSSTNAEQEQARINMEESRLALEQLKIVQEELAADKKKWDEEGINGTEDVKDAEDDLTDAIDAQTEAYEEMGEMAAAVDEARQEGAERVRDAMEALRRANEAYADSLAEVSTQQAAVNEAFAKLGPAGQEFALFLHSLRGGFRDFRDDIQSVMLPAVQDAIQGFLGSKSASIARDALIGLAEAFGKFAQALSLSFQGPAWMGFFQMLADLGPSIQTSYGSAFILFLEAMASMLTTAAPFALKFAQGLEAMMQAFADWAASSKGQEAFTNFLNWVEKIGPDVLEFFGALVEAFVAIAIALAPWGDVVLKALTGFLNIIADMDPATLGAILTTLAIVITASQLAYATMNLLMAGAALLTSPVGLVVFAIVGIGAALAYLYTQNEGFRDFVKGAWKEISEAFSKAWDRYIKPALADLTDALMELWDQVLQPFFEWLGPILVEIAKRYIPFIAAAFRAWAWYTSFVIREIMIPAILLIATVVEWLWKYVIRPVVNFIRDHWRDMADAILWTIDHILSPGFDDIAGVFRWLWREVARPTWNAMATAWENFIDGMVWVWENILNPAFNAIENGLEDMQGVFQTVVDAIGAIWNGLRNVITAPIRFVLETVINDGLIGGFNEVASWVGAEGFDPITVPNFLKRQYATGGILPGYTPGRDTHRFLSPTGGQLDLSGGEAIMRPEWTAAMGSGYVNQMNDLARRGGVKAVRQSMGFWRGGILPLPGGRFAEHAPGQYPGLAGDLNRGSGYEDFGAAVKAWKDGIVAQMNYIGDTSYGRWAVLNHGNSQSSLYAHLSNFAKNLSVGQQVKGGQTIGYVGDLGNTGNPPTSHLHFEVAGGAVGYADSSSEESRSRKIPKWLMKIVKDPLETVKNWAAAPFSKASDLVSNSPIFDIMKSVPGRLVKGVTDKVWDIVPGWVKTAAGWAGDAANYVVGGVSAVGDAITNPVGTAKDVGGWISDHFKDGGILPYNGTMMYDDGGYLPPGLTTVMNLTGKPEPVFTADQFDGMGGGLGGTLHYEPHFEGSNLTAEDVASDLNFTFRRIRRSGKYEGVGS